MFMFRGTSGGPQYLSVPGWQLVEIFGVDTSPKKQDGTSYAGTRFSCQVCGGSENGNLTTFVLFPPKPGRPNGLEAALIDEFLVAVGAVNPGQPNVGPIDPTAFVGAVLWVEFATTPGKRWLKVVRFARPEGHGSAGVSTPPPSDTIPPATPTSGSTTTTPASPPLPVNSPMAMPSAANGNPMHVSPPLMANPMPNAAAPSPSATLPPLPAWSSPPSPPPAWPTSPPPPSASWHALQPPQLPPGSRQ